MLKDIKIFKIILSRFSRHLFMTATLCMNKSNNTNYRVLNLLPFFLFLASFYRMTKMCAIFHAFRPSLPMLPVEKYGCHKDTVLVYDKRHGGAQHEGKERLHRHATGGCQATGGRTVSPFLGGGKSLSFHNRCKQRGIAYLSGK